MIELKFFGFGRSKKTASAIEARSLAEGTPKKLDGKRVLIVDDDPVFSKATALALQSAGCQVRLAQEGAEAIAALAEQPADAVLMDINFPPDVCNGGMLSWDGFQLMNWLRGLPGTTGARFIMVSSSDSVSNRQRAKELGVAAYFQKPLDYAQLLVVLNAGALPV